MLETDKAALKWARGHVGWQRQELVAGRAWSNTFKLKAVDGSNTYLKILPVGYGDEVSATAVIAQHFPDSLPEVIAHDIEHGYLLLRDHGGTALSSNMVSHTHRLLSFYASLQARAAKLPGLLAELPTCDVTRALSDLLFSLSPDRGSAPPGMAMATPLADFIGEAEAAYYWHALTAGSALIESQLALAKALPPTLAHGDLHVKNAAVLPNGGCVLYDWSEAAIGPAGLSLCNPLLLPVSQAIRVLAGIRKDNGNSGYELSRVDSSFEALADVIGWHQIYRSLICGYIEKLAGDGYAARETLLQGLPGSLLAGAMRWLVSWSLAAAYDDAQKRAGAVLLRAGLDEILELLRFFEAGSEVGNETDETARRLYARAPNITARQEADEVLLIDPHGEVICHLNVTAGGLWQLLGQPTSLHQAIAEMQMAFPHALPKQIAADALSVITDFVANGLVVPAATNKVP
ncbi:MAG: PqqD family protein [Rhodospirillaceae bacterium]|nr:PqqD family protein [Rhodospirillaceae bacterium]MBT5524682.1 PqqD family protein [Rhodospirillaceae bacterium]MBT5877987.1 PqqD family protein [Rhodospirillaceae bacterium]MBT6985282.1 PqqD family protein [Rhodospirillaceae bacterium]